MDQSRQHRAGRWILRRSGPLLALAGLLVLAVNVVLGRTVDRWGDESSIGSGGLLLLGLVLLGVGAYRHFD